MIQKYKLLVQYCEDCDGDVRQTIIPDACGEYVKYSDFIKANENLMDKNFSLQEEILDLQQTIKDLGYA